MNKVPNWREKGRKRTRNIVSDSESESGYDNKKSKGLYSEEELMEAFQTEMKERLFKSIKNCIDSKSNLEELKNNCLNKKRSDRVTITDAEQRIGVRATEIEISEKEKS
ncbi:hypothetical protein INT48_002079 [Thamnidium elegans]|uniref:Uncharacterized protein n=1 Tax=Thamnidium elegans TaxID=101142 RepID=A0A8H7SGT6_9FUNG|nr:hypothetical protein INT48_002079 [Thamnidium elegans]